MATIGDLESEAGIDPSRQERFDFWYRFRDLPADEVLEAGVVELRRLIEEKQRSVRK